MCKPNSSQREFHQLSRDTKLDVSYRYLIPFTERQPDALYAFKSSGFGEFGRLTAARVAANLRGTSAYCLFSQALLFCIIFVSICVSIFPVFPGWPKFKRLEAVTALFPASQTFQALMRSFISNMNVIHRSFKVLMTLVKERLKIEKEPPSHIKQNLDFSPS